MSKPIPQCEAIRASARRRNATGKHPLRAKLEQISDRIHPVQWTGESEAGSTSQASPMKALAEPCASSEGRNREIEVLGEADDFSAFPKGAFAISCNQSKTNIPPAAKRECLIWIQRELALAVRQAIEQVDALQRRGPTENRSIPWRTLAKILPEPTAHTVHQWMVATLARSEPVPVGGGAQTAGYSLRDLFAHSARPGIQHSGDLAPSANSLGARKQQNRKTAVAASQIKPQRSSRKATKV